MLSNIIPLIINRSLQELRFSQESPELYKALGEIRKPEHIEPVKEDDNDSFLYWLMFGMMIG